MITPGEIRTVTTYHYGRWVGPFEDGGPGDPWFWLSADLPERAVWQACERASRDMGQHYQVYRRTTTVRLDRVS